MIDRDHGTRASSRRRPSRRVTSIAKPNASTRVAYAMSSGSTWPGPSASVSRASSDVATYVSGPGGVEILGEARPFDEPRRCQIVVTAPFGRVGEAPRDHVRRHTEPARPNSGSGRRGAHEARAPQPVGRPSSDHAARPGRGALDEHPSFEVGAGGLDRRVRQVESRGAASAVLSHRERARMSGLERERLVDVGDEVDVLGARAERVRGGGERAQDVDGDDRATHRADLPAREEPSVGRSSRRLSQRCLGSSPGILPVAAKSARGSVS